MNAKARSLGMIDTRYVDLTGLNSGNQSSAKDLASLVKAAYQHPLIRDLSVSPEHAVNLGNRQLQYRNTNSLVRNPAWDIGLQKTGYIVEAGSVAWSCRHAWPAASSSWCSSTPRASTAPGRCRTRASLDRRGLHEGAVGSVTLTTLNAS